MRVLLDTNVLISYLLSPKPTSPIGYIVRACFQGDCTLVLPQEVLEELETTATQRRHLRGKITAAQIRELVDLLTQISECIPSIPEAIPAVTRDPKDDYLLTYALVGQVDYLVTGDADLLSLGQVDPVKIVTPHQFQEILDKQP